MDTDTTDRSARYRATWREDLQEEIVELVYGEMLRLPGQFLTQRPKKNPDDGANFVKELCRRFDDLNDGTRHEEIRPFFSKDLKTADQVLVHRERPMRKQCCNQSYDGSLRS